MRYLSWLAIAAMMLTGCSTRIDPFYPHHGGNNGQGGGGNNGGNGGGNTTPTVQLVKRSDWSVQYKGRTDYPEAGEVVEPCVEEMLFNYTGNNYFIFRTISDEDFESMYDSSVQSLIEGEAKDVRTMADNNDVKVTELETVFTKKDKTQYFDILVHGTYNAFIIELDKDGNPTYNYGLSTIVVNEEEATQAYKDWLGVWLITDGRVGYDIEISALENNHLYRVDGWETGNAAGSVQMNKDDDWIQTRFLPDNSLAFFIQFICSYKDEQLGDVDYMFVGTYMESTGEKVDDFEGWELAWAKMGAGYAVVNVDQTEYEVNGKTYKKDFDSMRYSVYSFESATQGWHHIHDVIPGFPMQMIRTKAATGIDRTPVHTSNYVRRTQPRVFDRKRIQNR